MTDGAQRPGRLPQRIPAARQFESAARRSSGRRHFTSASAILAGAGLALATAAGGEPGGLGLQFGQMSHVISPSCPGVGQPPMTSVPWYGIKEKMHMARDTIGGLAKAAGVGVETVR
jgi:hypothetical protein